MGVLHGLAGIAQGGVTPGFQRLGSLRAALWEGWTGIGSWRRFCCGASPNVRSRPALLAGRPPGAWFKAN